MNTDLFKKQIQKYATKEDLIFFSLILLVTLLALSSLLRANVLYVDDMRRVFLGYGWGVGGRPLASGIMRFLSGGPFIVDLSPVTQIIAAFVMALAAFVLVRVLLNANRSVPAFLAAVLVTLNPYFLEVYSYRYDSLPYAAGLLCAVLAASFIVRDLDSGDARPRLKSQLRVALVPAVLLIASLCLYQPATNAFFISIAGLILTRTQSQNFDAGALRTARIILIRSALAVVLAFILYWAIIHFLIDLDEYSQGKAALDIANAPTIIFANLRLSWELVWEDWRQSFLGITFIGIALCALGRLGYEIIFSPRTVNGASSPKLSVVWLLVLQLGGIAAIFFFATIGLLLINTDPLLQPRGYVSFGPAFAVLLMFGIAPVHTLMGGGRKLASAFLVLMPVAWLAGFALSYGNAAMLQDRYNKSLANFMVNDVIALTDGGLQANVAVLGSPGFAPAIRRGLISNFPLVSRLVIILPFDRWRWNNEFLQLSGLDVTREGSRHCYGLAATDAEIWKNSGFYKVTRRQDCLVFEFPAIESKS
jgi:hypothetical protein